MPMSFETHQLQRALLIELPHLKLEDEFVSNLAELAQNASLHCCPDVSLEESILDAWRPYLLSLTGIRDDEAVIDVVRGVLRRPVDLAANVEISGPCMDGVAWRPKVGDKIRERNRKAHEDQMRQEGNNTDDVEWFLSGVLESLDLQQKHVLAARAWCEQSGVSEKSQLVERIDEFCMALPPLRPLDRRRVIKHFTGNAVLNRCRQEWEPGPPRQAPGTDVVNRTTRMREAATFGDASNPYYIIQGIGRGGTASVYKCTRGGLVFAVKVVGFGNMQLMSASECEAAKQRARREASTLWSFKHPGIVTLYDTHETDAALYLVMEYIAGGDLLSHIMRAGRFSEPRARHVFVQLVHTLKYIHSKGVLHRDVKPENILVDSTTSEIENAVVKLADFGHAATPCGGCALTLGVGTPQYRAPEVTGCAGRIGGGAYDASADLWSLGVVLFIMLEGYYPFDPSNLTELKFAASSGTSKQGRDVVKKLVQVSPKNRVSLEACLKHPWCRPKDTKSVSQDGAPTDGDSEHGVALKPRQGRRVSRQISVVKWVSSPPPA